MSEVRGQRQAEQTGGETGNGFTHDSIYHATGGLGKLRIHGSEVFEIEANSDWDSAKPQTS